MCTNDVKKNQPQFTRCEEIFYNKRTFAFAKSESLVHRVMRHSTCVDSNLLLVPDFENV